MKLSPISVVAAMTAITPSKSTAQSIFEIASSNEDFSTLVIAVETAGLEDTLSEEDGTFFTVFAPTNNAFDALPDGTV